MVGRLFAVFALISTLVANTSEQFLFNLNELSDSGLSQIKLSLHSLNVNNSDGESLESFHEVLPNSIVRIILTDIPVQANFVVLQVHSYLENVTLSHDELAIHQNSVTGTNIGLTKMTSKVATAETFYLTYIGTSEKADVMLAVQAYGTNFPVPGGCNLEFQVEISPFLQTIYTDVYTEVDFAPAAPPHQVIADFNLSKTDECNLKPSHISYEVHYQYFPQMDFSKETYFKMISSMMTVGRIRNHSSIAKEKLFSVKTRRLFASYPRIGRVFSVTAQYSDYSVSYVPSVTYGCNPKDNMSCEILMSTPQKVLCISVMLLGLFVCFFGHYFFRIEFFLFGFFISGLTTYILVWIILGPTMALSVSIGIGFFAAGSILLAWGICQVVLVSFLFATLGLGFLFASIIVNPLLDVVDVLVFDVNYWGVFIGITLACPILMLSLSHKGNAISCSIIGSYAAVAAADFFVNSNLRFIVLNTIRRAISEKFRLALIALPFQQKDWLLVMGWCLLSAAGGGIQYLLIDCTRHVSRSRNFSSGPSWRRYRRVPNERTPLIKRINGKQFLLKI